MGEMGDRGRLKLPSSELLLQPPVRGLVLGLLREEAGV